MQLDYDAKLGFISHDCYVQVTGNPQPDSETYLSDIFKTWDDNNAFYAITQKKTTLNNVRQEPSYSTSFNTGVNNEIDILYPGYALNTLSLPLSYIFNVFCLSETSVTS